MDEQLAAIYGTGQTNTTTEEDMEKAAAAELLVKLADEQGVNLNDFSDEEIAEMVQELYGAKGAETNGAEQEKTAEQEKIAEADLLGRVMAHAYVQELGEIEKEAADKAGLVKRIGEATGISHMLRGAKAHAGAKKWMRNLPGDKGSTSRKAIGELATSGVRREAKEEALKGAKLFGKRVAAPGAGVVTAEEVARRSMKGKEKKSAADIEKLAEQKAFEMLHAQGWVDDQGNLLHDPSQVKQAEALTPEQEVEVRALQMLEENGFPVTWGQE